MASRSAHVMHAYHQSCAARMSEEMYSLQAGWQELGSLIPDQSDDLLHHLQWLQAQNQALQVEAEQLRRQVLMQQVEIGGLKGAATATVPAAVVSADEEEVLGAQPEQMKVESYDHEEECAGASESQDLQGSSEETAVPVGQWEEETPVECSLESAAWRGIPETGVEICREEELVEPEAALPAQYVQQGEWEEGRCIIVACGSCTNQALNPFLHFSCVQRMAVRTTMIYCPRTTSSLSMSAQRQPPKQLHKVRSHATGMDS